MQLANFLNKYIKKGGFILVDADLNEHTIGKPDSKPIKIKILSKT